MKLNKDDIYGIVGSVAIPPVHPADSGIHGSQNRRSPMKTAVYW